jgi:hypothetical protein
MRAGRAFSYLVPGQLMMGESVPLKIEECTMPIATLFLTVIMCVVALSDAALAQGAATGGVNDTGSPPMVFPIRPRQEPARSTAVPNVRRPLPHVTRLRSPYYHYYRAHRFR